METLPEECLMTLLLHVDSRDIFSIRCVSQQWYALSSQQYFWRRRWTEQQKLCSRDITVFGRRAELTENDWCYLRNILLHKGRHKQRKPRLVNQSYLRAQWYRVVKFLGLYACTVQLQDHGPQFYTQKTTFDPDQEYGYGGSTYKTLHLRFRYALVIVCKPEQLPEERAPPKAERPIYAVETLRISDEPFHYQWKYFKNRKDNLLEAWHQSQKK